MCTTSVSLDGGALIKKSYTSLISKPRLVLAIAAVVILAIYIGAVVRKPESLLSAARTLHGCIDRQDTTCVLKYLDAEELQHGGYTKAEVGRLLDDVIWPMMAGWHLSTLETNRPYEDAGALGSERIYRNNVGATLPVTIVVRQTDNGPKLIPVVACLYVTALQLNASADGVPAGERKLRIWSTETRRRLSELSATGIERFSAMSGKPMASQAAARTWKEWADHWEALADQLAAGPG